MTGDTVSLICSWTLVTGGDSKSDLLDFGDWGYSKSDLQLDFGDWGRQ